AWTGNANSLNNFSINNQMGQVASNATKAYSGLLGSTVTNAETVFSGSVSNFTGSKLGTVQRWIDNNNWYEAMITGTKLIIQKKVNGTLTTLGQISFSSLSGTSYTLRFNLMGTMLSAKAWQTGTSEPSNWMVTTMDSSLSSGFCGLLLYLPGGMTAAITAFQATSQ
ncbi:MAG: hypothetical protein M3Z24_01135, partial [Chloroflexota bacterium]|nr:hypothetical protein [Chloroflexota bacterium]